MFFQKENTHVPNLFPRPSEIYMKTCDFAGLKCRGYWQELSLGIYQLKNADNGKKKGKYSK